MRPTCGIRVRPTRRPAVSILLLLLIPLALGLPVRALAQDAPETLDEALRHCLSARGNSIVLVGSCSAAIESGQVRPEGLALALTVRASAFGSLGRPDLGLADIGRALDIAPALLDARVVRSYLRGRLRDYRGAIADLDAVIAARPGDSVSLRRRGEFRNWLDEHDAALVDFSAALAVRLDADTLVDRAIAHGDAGEDGPERADLAAALHLVPGDQGALFARGQLYFRNGAFAAAAADFVGAADGARADAYYVIWAYLGAAHSGIADAATALARRARRLDLDEWPGQIIELYLGRRTAASVQPPPGGHIPWMTEGYRCEADFYLGEYLLLGGHRRAARTSFAAAAKTGINEFVEYQAARVELARLDR